MRTARIHGTLEERNAARLARSSSKRMRYEEIKKEENARIEKEAQEKRVVKLGRPTSYTEALGNDICNELSQGKSLSRVCREMDISMSAVFSWFGKHPTFTDKYTRAKQEATDAMAEEILDIADDGSNDWMTATFQGKEIEVKNKEVVERSRLRIETRKWLMAKMKPKRYGDKLDVTSGGEVLPMPILGGQAFLALDKAQEAAMVRHSEVIHTVPALPTKKNPKTTHKG